MVGEDAEEEEAVVDVVAEAAVIEERDQGGENADTFRVCHF